MKVLKHLFSKLSIRKLQLVSLLMLLGLFVPTYASAHVLKSEGSIGAVLHVSPDDDPIAGESTNFFFEMKDKDGKFKPENCDCSGIVLLNGKIIHSSSLFDEGAGPSFENASFTFTFPEKDIYKVRISGKPVSSNTFTPFNLEWDVRVSRGLESKKQNSAKVENEKETNWLPKHILHILLIAPTSLFIFFFILKEKGGDKN